MKLPRLLQQKEVNLAVERRRFWNRHPRLSSAVWFGSAAAISGALSPGAVSSVRISRQRSSGNHRCRLRYHHWAVAFGRQTDTEKCRVHRRCNCVYVLLWHDDADRAFGIVEGRISGSDR
jgi:hypothetical protein